MLTGAAGPEWSKNDVMGLLQQAEMAASAQSVEAKDAQLVNAAGYAYQVQRSAGESNDGYARRILLKREPAHSTVRRGQWLLALMRVFYQDVGERARALARFETNRRDRQFFEEKSQSALQIAKAIAPLVQVRIEGVEEYMAPLPIAPGAAPSGFGAKAYVLDNKVRIEALDRATFDGDRPNPEAERTNGGLREFYGAFKMFNTNARLFGEVDRAKGRAEGHVQAFLPAAKPAVYLNEIARAAKAAKMHTIFLMTIGPESGELREIRLSLMRGWCWLKAACWSEMATTSSRRNGALAVTVRHTPSFIAALCSSGDSVRPTGPKNSSCVVWPLYALRVRQ